MIRATSDPFYRDIIARLNERLDPGTFEACVWDLLRDKYPTLVPVCGGSDRGMDGAIADSEGEAFPLICTTGENVLRNLSDSLDSQLKKRFPRRKAVFATSRSLSPDLRFKLEECAREREFILVQIVDQAGLADLLYRNARWHRELLRLPGTPRALSIVPLGPRTQIQIDPVGRDADLEWLRTTRNDRLLVGEPGSGKTFLLEHLVRQGWGLFLASDDRTEIANGVREQEPGAIVVDDAHAEPARLEHLLRLREEIGADFSIVATSWIGDQDRVVTALGLSSSDVRKLQPLGRDYILDILRRAGVETTDEIMRRLVNQSRNKPGLAVTLAWLWRRGDWQDVLKGKALVRSLGSFFDSVGEDTYQVLAAFGLGGDRGMRMEVVREFLGLQLAQIQNRIFALRDNGILTEEGDALAVWPRELRSALLGKVFFCGPAAGRRYQELLDKVEASSYGKAVENLVVARGLGVEVPLEELRKLVFDSKSQGVWANFTALGEDEAHWALEHYQGDLLDIADPALAMAPGTTIPRLLHRSTKPVPEHLATPDRFLADWCLAPVEEWLERRQRIACAAGKFLRDGGNCGVGVGAIMLALSPVAGESSIDPGIGRTLRLSCGLAPELEKIEEIWEKHHNAVNRLDAKAWAALKGRLREWSFPNHLNNVDVPEADGEFMRSFAFRMLCDLAQTFQGSPAPTTAIRRLAALYEFEVALEPDPVFEILYPDFNYHPLYRTDEKHSRALEELAEQFSRKPPTDVARSLHGHASEAAKVGFRITASLKELLDHLAAKTAEPETWVDTFLDLGTGPVFVQPFLNRVEIGTPGWGERIERCLDDREYTELAVESLLRTTNPPPQLLEKALEHAASYPELVSTLSGQQIPVVNLVKLLRHPDPITAFAAAVGHARTKATVRAEVRDAWRAAVVGVASNKVRQLTTLTTHDLGKILESDAELACDWLRARIRAEEFDEDVGSYVPLRAVRMLGSEQRARLLEEIAEVPLQPPSFISWLIRGLIKNDGSLFEKLLADDRLRIYHLLPLGRGLEFGNGPKPLGEEKIRFALQALKEGYEPQKVAEAFFPNPLPRDGKYWQGWMAIFESLADHRSQELREVARQGGKIAARRLRAQQERERKIELEGLVEFYRPSGGT